VFQAFERSAREALHARPNVVVIERGVTFDGVFGQQVAQLLNPCCVEADARGLASGSGALAGRADLCGDLKPNQVESY
jgi:hypothetical protein